MLGDKIWQLKGRQRIKNLQSHRKTEDKPANIEEQIRITGNTRGQEQTKPTKSEGTTVKQGDEVEAERH